MAIYNDRDFHGYQQSCRIAALRHYVAALRHYGEVTLAKRKRSGLPKLRNTLCPLFTQATYLYREFANFVRGQLRWQSRCHIRLSAITPQAGQILLCAVFRISTATLAEIRHIWLQRCNNLAAKMHDLHEAGDNGRPQV